MGGQWHGGKGDGQRPEAAPNAYADNYGGIDWNARSREGLGLPPDGVVTLSPELQKATGLPAQVRLTEVARSETGREHGA